MPLQPVAFSTYPHSVPLFANGVRLVNCYSERAEGPAKRPFLLVGCPGMKEFAAPSAASGLEVRGFHWLDFNSTLYAVIGSFLFSIASDGSAAEVASGLAGTGPVTFVSDSDQMVIVTTPGTDDYLWTAAGGLSQLTGENMQDWRDAAFLDGRAVFVPHDNAGRFWWTEVEQLATIEDANFANAESSADSLTRMLEVDRLLWMLGPQSAEPFYSTGDDAAPFRRHADRIDPVGIAAADSAAVLHERGFFLAHSRKLGLHVAMIAGSRIRRVSTNALDEILETVTTSDALGFAYGVRGHLWYFLVLPTAGRTFAFDAAMGLDPPIWHERQSGVQEVAAWNARHAIVAHGKVLVGGNGDGKIYELDYDTRTDAGEDRLTMFPAEMRSSGERWNRLDRLQVDLTTGRGPAGAEADGDPEPVIVMQLSRDGGERWGRERWKKLGHAGKPKKSVVWRGCGRFLNCVARFKMTDAVPRQIVRVHANGEPGRFG